MKKGNTWIIFQNVNVLFKPAWGWSLHSIVNMAWCWNYNSQMGRKKCRADFASQVVIVSWYILTTVIYWSIGLCPREIRLHFWKSGREIKKINKKTSSQRWVSVEKHFHYAIATKRILLEKCDLFHEKKNVSRGNWYLVTHINHAYKNEIMHFTI